MSRFMAYFDHNATTPMCPPALEAWRRVQERLWHNASSLYREAAAARAELERCRERLADLTGSDDPEQIVFTSGATEGANGFFRGCADWTAAHSGVRVRVFISPFEHPAVREPARRYAAAETLGRHWIESLDDSGAVEGDHSSDAHYSFERLALAWMAANNETGEIFPWERLMTAAPSVAALGASRAVFCDASQWFGKLPAGAFAVDAPNPSESKASESKASGSNASGSNDPTLTVVGSGHKFGGPKGVGFVRLGAARDAWGAPAWQVGGPQEQERRAGTEDVAAVAALVAALEWCEDQMPGNPGPRDAFEHDLGWPVVAGDRPRLWNTSMVVAPRHQNKRWLARLSQRGIQCSTGSACSSGQDGDSQVLAAMGLEPEARRRVLRFSSGWATTADDWLALRHALQAVERELKEA